MYSSVFNQDYASVYYDLLETPIKSNNRLALLPSANPFLLHFLGIRYLETAPDQVPSGYRVLWQDETLAVSENPGVLPLAYLTDACMPASQFQSLPSFEKPEALTRYTVVPDCEAAPVRWRSRVEVFKPRWEKTILPDTVQVTGKNGDYELRVSKESQVTLELSKVVKNQLLQALPQITFRTALISEIIQRSIYLFQPINPAQVRFLLGC